VNPDGPVEPARDDIVERLTAHLDRVAAREQPTGADERLDFVVAALASPAAWTEPPDLRDAILIRVRAQADVAPQPQPAAAPEQAPEPAPRPVIPPRPRWQRLAWAVPVAAAAAVLFTFAVLGAQRLLAPGPDATFTASGQQVSAEVEVTSEPSGFKITLDARGLPGAPTGTYYAAWLRRGASVVPIGTFHARRHGDEVVLWSGVDPADYSTFSVTLQREDEPPLPTAPSARRVLLGTFTR
jgi:hypothetical protein